MCGATLRGSRRLSNPAMSCPVCGEVCRCSRAGAASFLIDPDEYDSSEERFAASLEDAPDGRAMGETVREARQDGAWLLASAVGPGARCMATVQVTSEPQGERGMEEGAIWRQEVASRVESYRARRRRPVRERSLPLDFERAVNRELTQGNLADSAEGESPVLSPESRLLIDEPPGNEEPLNCADSQLWNEEPSQESTVGTEDSSRDPELGTRDSTNIIEFPRQAVLPVMPPSLEELAEPVIDRPRILDVSEEVEATAPLADISVAPEQDPRLAVEFELPLQVAPMAQRVFSGLIDILIVLVGAAVFVMIVLRAGVPIPQEKGGFLLAMTVPGFFWAIYEYMFLVYAGSTPGMQMARLQLVTFNGVPARRAVRRGRAVAMALSTLALGLGVVWALLDEDTLCWHDRITRTYVVGCS